MAILAEDLASESIKVRHYTLASENLANLAITWKQCKIGGKSLLISNRKSYRSFQLVPTSVTLNGVMAVITFRYFTDFSKPAFQHKASAHKKECSRSLSHLLMSFLLTYVVHRIVVGVYLT